MPLKRYYRDDIAMLTAKLTAKRMDFCGSHRIIADELLGYLGTSERRRTRMDSTPIIWDHEVVSSNLTAPTI